MKRTIAIIALVLSTAALHAESTKTVLIPAAGHLIGAAGLSFYSDIAIHNLRNTQQILRLTWLPQSGTGQESSTKLVTIVANGYLNSDDFAEEVMGRTGLGAIVVSPLLENGQDDEHSNFTVASRIWSPTNHHGEVSQSFPPIRFGNIDSRHLALTGLRVDVQHRLNVGIVNLDKTGSHTFRVTIPGLPTQVKEVTLDPYSTTQVTFSGVFAPGNLRVDVEVLPSPGGGHLSLWTAYGSVVENASGDSWSSIGVDIRE
ncbi:MAG TPA: hypothetical protein VEK79_12180 [Thermoanaerobaculia bacterium]|nr:hypothetical protein [Thermoanaerobaculia bacterium]